MAQSSLENKEDTTLVLNTTIEERVYLQSPGTTTFSNEDTNTLKHCMLYCMRNNDDESIPFIHANAWRLYHWVRKTQQIPKEDAPQLEQAINSTDNIMTGLMYTLLGPPGANILNLKRITDKDKFTKGPMARMTSLVAMYMVLGQGMEEHLPGTVAE